jgi:hypothetical protein
MAGGTRLQRARLVYGRGDSSTEGGGAHLQRGRLIHREGDLSMEGEARLRREKLV